MASKSRVKSRLNSLHTTILHTDKYAQMRIMFLLILLSLSWIFTQAVQIHAINNSQLQEGIAKEIIRLHVIANSDSDEDQQLKYQVKDALVQALKPYLNEAHDIEEAQDILKHKLPLIQEISSHVIEENGYKYMVTASLSPSYFPTRVYGGYTFPPGSYEALQVKIGDAQGKNWWCVMFPPLCFVDETYSIVDKDSEEKLKYLLSEEEFEELKNDKTKIKVKFKILDYIKKLFEE